MALISPESGPRNAKPSHKANTHSVWATLQQHVNGSVDIPVAIVQCDHRLILVLACDVNQLEKVKWQDETGDPLASHL